MRKKSGFTLTEIIVVVAIVTVLGALLISTMTRTRRMAYLTKCDAQLKSIALALDAYNQERGNFPVDLTELENNKYLQEHSILHCPSDPNPEGTYADYYVLRARRSDQSLPILVCPFHEDQTRGVQAYVGRYTSQFMTKPAVLTSSRATTIEHPGKRPVSGAVGMPLRGADKLITAKNGSATIRFADGSTATLKRNTTVTVLQSFVDRNSNSVLYTLLRQTAGEATYVVNKGSKFDVATPAATAGALGTKFTISVEPNYDTTLLVQEGKVRFTDEKRTFPAKPGVPAHAKNRNPKFK